MRAPYPRSFLGLLIAGVALVAAPLVIGLATSAIHTDRLPVVGQNALNRAVQATQASRRVAGLVRELERAARQAVILGEDSIPAHYPGLRRELTATVERLADLPFDAQQRAKLEQVLAIGAVYLGLAAPRNPDADGAELRALLARFAEAGQLADEIIDRSDALIDRESRRMTAIAQRARETLFWLSLAAIPLAIGVIWGFATMLARPVRELD